LLMMRDGFIAGTNGIVTADPKLDLETMPLVRSSVEAEIDAAMSVSFGFGGSCASLMFRAWQGV